MSQDGGFIFSQFWRLEVQAQGTPGLVSGGGSLLGLQMATFSLCFYVVFPGPWAREGERKRRERECVRGRSFSSYKAINPSF
jgi:hypothetical protein